MRVSERTKFLHDEELERLRRMALAGSDLAPAAALHHCSKYGYRPPDWVISSAANAFCERLNSQSPRKRGRAAGPVERYRQDHVDYTRWGAVNYARDLQKQAKYDHEQLLKHPELRMEWREHVEKMLNWAGSDWLRAYECASLILRGSPCAGSSETIKASYQRVQRQLSSGRYHYLDHEFLMAIGLDTRNLDQDRSGRKIGPLYTLT